MYSTTLHTINNAITTLSGLSPSCNVYRGVSGGMLPEKFLAPDAQDNFRGGVELGFMSTTTNREVAYFYARGSNGLVFEMFMGLVDKGMSPSLARCHGALKGVALDYPLSAMRLSYRTSRRASAAALDSRNPGRCRPVRLLSVPLRSRNLLPPVDGLGGARYQGRRLNYGRRSGRTRVHDSGKGKRR